MATAKFTREKPIYKLVTERGYELSRDEEFDSLAAGKRSAQSAANYRKLPTVVMKYRQSSLTYNFVPDKKVYTAYPKQNNPKRRKRRNPDTLQRKLTWLRDHAPAVYDQLVVLPPFRLSDKQLREEIRDYESRHGRITFNKSRRNPQTLELSETNDFLPCEGIRVTEDGIEILQPAGTMSNPSRRKKIQALARKLKARLK